MLPISLKKPTLLTFCWLGNVTKRTQPNLGVYVTFDSSGVNSALFSTWDYTLMAEQSPLCGQLGFSHGGWYKVLNKRWICQHKQSDLCARLSGRTLVLQRSLPYLKLSFAVWHVCWQWWILLAGLSPLSWRYLFILQHSFPQSYSTELLLNSRHPTHLRSWPWEALPCNTPRWQYM